MRLDLAICMGALLLSDVGSDLLGASLDGFFVRLIQSSLLCGVIPMSRLYVVRFKRARDRGEWACLVVSVTVPRYCTEVVGVGIGGATAPGPSGPPRMDQAYRPNNRFCPHAMSPYH